jgi:hypothetical protein
MAMFVFDTIAMAQNIKTFTVKVCVAYRKEGSPSECCRVIVFRFAL